MSQHAAHDLPRCPMCSAPVLRTHRCTGKPAPLRTMPDHFRDLVAQAIASGIREDGATDYADTLDLDLPPAPSTYGGTWSR